MPRGRVEHVVMGPEPHFARCLHCGETLPKPPRPCRIELFIAWGTEFVELHRACKPRTTSRVPEAVTA